ncbi:hypothetical protein EDB92DRAFT_708815 [Lactarius akahatsu]|uniref:Uncharacterized protein n=1 Tax=Lactarius akahatsu TaxID=416441 RepID=A0AAD4L3A0_9AGAM|nr:hypothetical protein EDB92DRAFT_708815 [Lactarius akahatsu]
MCFLVFVLGSETCRARSFAWNQFQSKAKRQSLLAGSTSENHQRPVGLAIDWIKRGCVEFFQKGDFPQLGFQCSKLHC